MELESYHFFYAYNFEVTSRCLEVLWTSVYAMLEPVVVMKLKTKWFCIEIPLCEVVELCGF